MKKFNFGLETVLNYKEQTENNIRTEHSAIMQQVINQEKKIEEIREKERSTTEELNEARSCGFNVLQMQTFERYLNYLKGELKRELHIYAGLKKREEAKRSELIEARTETKSIGKLKEKRFDEYKKLETKQEELFIEEIVSRRNIILNNQ